MFLLLECIGELGEKEVCVVPKSWLIHTEDEEEVKRCYWPKNSRSAKLWIRIKKHATGQPNQWESFEYARILKESSSYQDILEYEERALDKSEVSSSEAADDTEVPWHQQEPTKRQTRPPSRYTCIRTTDDEDEDEDRSPSPILHLTSSPKQLPIPQRPDKRVRSRSPIAKIQLPKAPLPPTRSSQSPSTSRSSILPTLTGPTPSWKKTTTPASNTPSLEMQQALMEKLLKKVEAVAAEVRSLGKKMDRIEWRNGSKDVPDNQLPALPEGFTFPLDSENSLEQLETTLKDQEVRHRMCLHLGNLGGSSAKDSLYRLMREMLLPALSVMFSMEGKKGKRRFKDLQNVKGTIYDAIMKRFATITVVELDKALGEWLACSSDRGGGRKRREHERARMQFLAERENENQD